jgi:hypothetical protein
MLEFYYDGLVSTFGCENVHLLATDTDSLIIQIFAKDLPKQFKNDKSIVNHNLRKYIDIHEYKTIGLFKDECASMMTEFVGLRSKMYHYKTVGGKEKGVAKGVTTQIKKSFNFDLYKHVLDSHSQVQHKMSNLRSFNHVIHLMETNKTTLSAYDNKRVFIEGSYETLPIGFNGLTKSRE